jgi:hypothetical protein
MSSTTTDEIHYLDKRAEAFATTLVSLPMDDVAFFYHLHAYLDVLNQLTLTADDRGGEAQLMRSHLRTAQTTHLAALGELFQQEQGALSAYPNTLLSERGLIKDIGSSKRVYSSDKNYMAAAVLRYGRLKDQLYVKEFFLHLHRAERSLGSPGEQNIYFQLDRDGLICVVRAVMPSGKRVAERMAIQHRAFGSEESVEFPPPIGRSL